MGTFDDLPETRRRGLERLEEGYGLSDRDRRLLLIWLLAGSGGQDVLTIQIPAAHAAGELSDDELREIVILMCHYAGWPMGSRINAIVEDTIAKAARKRVDP